MESLFILVMNLQDVTVYIIWSEWETAPQTKLVYLVSENCICCICCPYFYNAVRKGDQYTVTNNLACPQKNEQSEIKIQAVAAVRMYITN